MPSSKKTATEPGPDDVRSNVIQWFYNLNKKGGAPKGMQDLCKGIKTDYGYKGPLVKQHLTLLVDLGYVAREVVMTKVQTGQTYRDQARVSYRIAAKGIEFVEGKSQFSDKARYPGINITATGGSSVVLGDGNVVNSSYREVYDELGRMAHAVADSTELNDTSKLEASVAIETIKDQLAIPRPNRTIIDAAWETATRLCTTATLGVYAHKVGEMLATVFP